VLLSAFQQHDWPVTCSIGAVTFIAPAATVDDMISAAEGLLVKAKRAGKNTIRHELGEVAASTPELMG